MKQMEEKGREGGRGRRAEREGEGGGGEACKETQLGVILRV